MPRPAFAIIAFALGISAFGVALTCGIVGLAQALNGEEPGWLRIALGVALMDAVIGIELGRRAGTIAPPHATFRKVGSGLSLAAILIIVATAAKLAA